MDSAFIGQDIRITMHRVTEVEGRLSEMEETVKSHEECLVKLQPLVTQLEDRAKDMEEQSRHNNLRVVGIPEEAEGVLVEAKSGDYRRSLITWEPREKK
ncbi:hypothetical protein NDU88_002775 [Pleurodeles waltl]|uniref:Uncharacterized protein n=1 Tax=Pleurodeles waltl TaxID=8319 RepID=A0AAV7MP16_PLEWA|nr:hypothetical protein NDU88_002775 [Pleurodeles waltl]